MNNFVDYVRQLCTFTIFPKVSPLFLKYTINTPFCQHIFPILCFSCGIKCIFRTESSLLLVVFLHNPSSLPLCRRDTPFLIAIHPFPEPVFLRKQLFWNAQILSVPRNDRKKSYRRRRSLSLWVRWRRSRLSAPVPSPASLCSATSPIGGGKAFFENAGWIP